MDFMETIRIIPRSLLSLFFLFLITKLMGKKQVSEFSIFDYVIGISIGNFTAEMTMNFDNQYINGIVAIFCFGFTAWLISKVTMKSIILRRIIIGVPTVVIQNGKIIEPSLKKLNIDINDLLEQCRNNNVFDISEIEYAVMEVNGKVNIMKKAMYESVTPNDLNLKVENKSLVSNIIIDGKIMKNNLNGMNKDISWLEKQIKVKGVDINNVLLATLDDQEKINIYQKNNEKPKEILE